MPVLRAFLIRGASTRLAWAVAAGLLAAAIFWVRGIAYLYERHPHEDAFILFRYVEHVASGQGIAFNGGGPPTEGATDFLFLMMMSVLVWLGVDVAVAAVWLNALGAGLVAFLLTRIGLRSDTTPAAGLAALLLAASIPFLAGAHASYDGFGTELYCALALLCYCVSLDGRAWALACTPYLALALALYRPDGAILGAGFYLVTLGMHARAPSARKKLLFHGALSLLGGGAYFVWRYWYFGELLPLPLYVKSRGVERLPGLSSNKDWFDSGSGPWPLLLATGVFVITLVVLRARSFHGKLLATIPAWLLLASLMFAYQSQNVDWRFQAPAYTVFMAAMIAMGADVAGRSSRAWLRTLVFVACLVALLPALRAGKKLWALDYMDSFAVRFGRVLNHGTMALTEAGRLAYWSTTNVYDMIGLNTPYTAKHPPSLAYLDTLDPDIVMFHAAGTIDFDKLPVASAPLKTAGVLRLDAGSLPGAVNESFQRYLRAVPADYRSSDPPTKIAPVVMNLFVATRRNYDVFAVHYNHSYTHIFGVKVDQSSTRDLEDAILTAYDQTYLSYAAAKRFPPSLAPTIVRLVSQGRAAVGKRVARLTHWARLR